MGEIILFLGVLGILPVFAWLADGIYAKNIPRGLVQIFLFIFTMLLCVLMLKIAKMMFVVAVPIFLFLIILFAGKRKKR